MDTKNGDSPGKQKYVILCREMDCMWYKARCGPNPGGYCTKEGYVMVPADGKGRCTNYRFAWATAERMADILDDVFATLTETKNGRALYDVLAGDFGMSDDEIIKVGFTALKPFTIFADKEEGGEDDA